MQKVSSSASAKPYSGFKQRAKCAKHMGNVFLGGVTLDDSTFRSDYTTLLQVIFV